MRFKLAHSPRLSFVTLLISVVLLSGVFFCYTFVISVSSKTECEDMRACISFSFTKMQSYLTGISNSTAMVLAAASDDGRVFLGKGGWLFYRESFKSVKNTLYTEEELHRWKEYLEARNTWFTQHGIRYVYVINPEKETVYPEYAPRQFPFLATRRQQLVSYINEHTTVPILDVTDAILSAKKRQQVYLLLNSHWNSAGAYAAYVALVSFLESIFPVGHLTDVTPIVSSKNSDLLPMMNVQWLFDSEDTVLYSVVNQMSSVERIKNDIVIYTHPQSEMPVLLMYHDSFAYPMMDFIAEHFSLAEFHRVKKTAIMNKEDIERVRPDLVIEQRTERMLFPTSTQPQIDSWMMQENQ